MLAYLRDGVVAVGHERDVRMLGRLRREFDFYCVDLLEESVLIVGGQDGDNHTLRSVVAYHPHTDSWTESIPMLEARYNFGTCVIDGNIYVCGGVSVSGTPMASVERFNGTLWSSVVAMPTALFAHGTCSVDGSMYVLGGWDGRDNHFRRVLKYLPDGWSDVAPMPAARAWATICVLNNAIYVIGGMDSEYQPCADVYKYVVNTDTWSIVSPMHSVRCCHVSCVFEGMIYAAGGYHTTDLEELNSMERYDPASDIWREMSALSNIVFGMFVADNGIHVIHNNGTTMNKYEADGSWSAASSMVPPRTKFQICVLTENKFDAMIRRALL